MNHSLLRFLAGFSIILVLAFSSNPPNGRTGAPGDGLCSDCHSGGAQTGNVMITGMPATVTPGQTYTLTVISTTTSSSVLAGFQMVGLHDDGNVNAGSMDNASAGSTITVVGSGRSYHEHNPAAGFGGGTTVSWTVDWTAPVSGPDGDITFYAASVLANGNSNNGGDGVVTTNVSGDFTGIDPLMADITVSTPESCVGANDGTATVSVTGGTPPYSYSWSNGETGQTATMLPAGNQGVTVTDDNSETATAMMFVGSPTPILPNAAVDNHITCNGDNDGQASTNPTGGTPPYTYAWTDGQNTMTASALTPGIHGVTVTDANMCTGTANVTINEPDLLVLDPIVQENISCNGFNDGTATVAAMGGSPNYTYGWSNGQAGPTANNLTPGLHTVTVTDANNCMDGPGDHHL